MQASDRGASLRISLDTENFELSPNEIRKMERGLDPLRKPIRNFPVADLHIMLTQHSGDRSYRIKVSLVLPGRTITTGDLDETLYSGFERCVRKLIKRVEAYKADLENEPEISKQQKRTRQHVIPTQDPDPEQIQQAVDAGDYPTFRLATYVYEEPIRERVGRWIDRYPELSDQLGRELAVDDIVEEVFLNAFERYPQRPAEVRLGQWLESLIDPSMKMILRAPEEELENIRFVRTLNESPEWNKPEGGKSF